MKLLFTAFIYVVFLTVSFAQSGTLDNTFGVGGKVNLTNINASGYPEDAGDHSIMLQTDGKILVVGNFNNGTNTDFAIARYNTNGTLDNTFGVGGITTTDISFGDDLALALAIQSDEKIVVTGFSKSGTTTNYTLVRYNIDGTLDNTFGTGGIVLTAATANSFTCNAIALQSDGKIVVAGTVGSNFGMLRYTTTGTLDNTFGTNGMVSTYLGAGISEAYAIAILSTGKILLAGYVYDGSLAQTQNDFCVVKYNSDGSLDNTFGSSGIKQDAIGSYYDEARSIAIQSDGKIVVGGYISTPTSTLQQFALIRYSATGTRDNTFGTSGLVKTLFSTGSDDQGRSVAIQTDGKILVVGSTYKSSNSDFAVARYTSTGALDATFGTSGKISTDVGGASDFAYSLRIQPDSKILVYGNSGTGASIVRYYGDNLLGSDFTQTHGCTGGNTNTAKAIPQGGVTPYTYQWSNGQTTQTATGLVAGNYTVTITDAKSSSAISTVTVTSMALLSFSSSGSDSACTNNGSAYVSLSGGLSPYTYNWSNGSTSQTATGLIVGTYTITVTDANSCSSISTVAVNTISAGTYINVQSITKTCKGAANGAIALQVGGTGNTFIWNNGQSIQNPVNLSAGTYTVTLTDQNSCTMTASASVTLFADPVINAGKDTIIFLGTSAQLGATGDLNFLWTPSSALNNDTIVNPTASPDKSTQYTVVGTDSNNCSAKDSVWVYIKFNCITPSTMTDPRDGKVYKIETIGDQTWMTENLNYGTMMYCCNLGLQKGQKFCFYDGSGPGDCSEYGGLYTFAVAVDFLGGSHNNSSTGNPIPIGDIQGICPDNWHIPSDAEWCTLENYLDPNTDLSCNKVGLRGKNIGGILKQGGTSNWLTPNTPGANPASVCFNALPGGYAPAQNGGDFYYESTNGFWWTSSEANAVQVIYRSLSHNNSQIKRDISQKDAAFSIRCVRNYITTSKIPVSCKGGNDGIAIVTGCEGPAPYSYAWSTNPLQYNDTASGLIAGNYTVTVTDANAKAATTVVSIKEPVILSSTLKNTPATCEYATGTASVSAAGGNAPYFYTWSTSPTQFNDTITGLTGGTYTVTINDSKICSQINTLTIPKKKMQIQITNGITVYGGCTGTGSINPTNGIPPYTYLWSTGDTTNIIDSLCAGIYTVTITDDNNCNGDTTIFISPDCSGALSTMTDPRDGKIYKTVTIGNQTWMAENLNYGTYNGYGQTAGQKYCYSSSQSNCAIAGGLYFFSTAVNFLGGSTNTTSDGNPIPIGNIQGVCPTGWHLPSDEEWCTLENFVEPGADTNCSVVGARGVNVGGSLKQAGTARWKSPNASGPYPNSVCFNAGATTVPSNSAGIWWTSSEFSPTKGWARRLNYNETTIRRDTVLKSNYYSVRCVKDSTDYTTSLNKNTFEKNEFELFPNPNTGSFTIITNMPGIKTLQIFDITGKLMLTEILHNGKTTIDNRNLSEGIYNVCITSPNQKINKRLVIIK